MFLTLWILIYFILKMKNYTKCIKVIWLENWKGWCSPLSSGAWWGAYSGRSSWCTVHRRCTNSCRCRPFSIRGSGWSRNWHIPDFRTDRPGGLGQKDWVSTEVERKQQLRQLGIIHQPPRIFSLPSLTKIVASPTHRISSPKEHPSLRHKDPKSA